METKDWIQIITIFITLILSLVNLFVSSIGAKKTRRSTIISSKRKERMDQLTTLYSKIAAMCNPYTIVTFNNDFYKLLFEYSNQFKMLLNRSFQKDTVLACKLDNIVDSAVIFYKSSQEQYNPTDFNNYKLSFYENTRAFENDFIVHMSTEWVRIQIEAEKGKKVKINEWEKLYNENKEYYIKYNNPK